MSEAEVANVSSVESTGSDKSSSEPAAKPSLEQAFSESKKPDLSRAKGRSKKLGISSFTAGQDELIGTSKKAKSPFPKKEAPQEESVSFDKAPDETAKALPKEALKEDPKPVEKLDEKPISPKMHKVKVDGEEFEVTEDVLIRDYQIRKASDKRFQEASEMEKRLKAWQERLVDPDRVAEVFFENGYTPEKLYALAEKAVADRLKLELMTPEQRKIAFLEAREAQRQRDAEETVKRMQMEKAQAEAQKHADYLQKSIIDVMEKAPDLPKDSDTVRRVISAMRTRINAQKNIPDHLKEDVTPSSVLDDVRASIVRDLQSKVKGFSPEELAQFLGKEKLDDYRKWELSQIKNPIAKPMRPENQNTTQPTQKRHYKTMEEWKANQVAAGVKRW